MYQDTIAAVSTPAGEAGIGIVRLSGGNARSIARRLFTGKLEDHRLVYGYIVDPESLETVDEVLVSYMAAPRTYTKEDMVEINCHGGIVPLRRILELALDGGARLADPGEFTLRAFLNGRIDLLQAESVLDVIQAKTQSSLNFAIQGLTGKLSAKLRGIREELLSVLAYLTVRIDFPEDEIEDRDSLTSVKQTRLLLRNLIDSAEQGIVYRQGINTAIVGRPNVGKSSLLNLLLRESRAIVTSVPGTTRDTLEEVVNINGVPFVLVDTAGIIDSKDLVESLGVERSRRAIQQASLVLLVVDTSETVSEADNEIMNSLHDKMVLVVANKCDLPAKTDLSGIKWPIISTSALTGEGLEIIEGEMVKAALGGKISTPDGLLVTNIRHKDALVRAEYHLSEAGKSLEKEMPDDFVTIDLTAALNSLGEITGETVTEDLLNNIFTQFCIGK